MDYSSKILNNVLIFQFERPVAYKIVVSFAFIQLFGMYSMVTNIYDTYCQDLFEAAKSWKERIKSHPFSLVTIAIGCIFGKYFKKIFFNDFVNFVTLKILFIVRNK